MTYSIYYLMATWQNEPLAIVKVKDSISKQYQNSIKKANCFLEPCPSFEFNEDNGLHKATIETKADF